jgi:ubiquinone/menaquinone biosynthesis C-methylase UbiE
MPSLRELLYRFYWKAEASIVPGLTSSQYCYYRKLRWLLPGRIWLDLGCGHQVFAEWMAKEQSEVIASSAEVHGIDLDWESLRAHTGISNKVFGDLSSLPFKTDSIDVVSANMVAEHLSDPETVLSEIYRVLKPNGAFIFHTPNYCGWTIQVASRVPDWFKRKLIRFFEGRHEEDVFHTHYRMNTGSAIRQLAAKTDFELEDLTMVSTSALTPMLGPVVLGELLYIRYLEHPSRARFRSNIVAILRKHARR